MSIVTVPYRTEDRVFEVISRILSEAQVGFERIVQPPIDRGPDLELRLRDIDKTLQIEYRGALAPRQVRHALERRQTLVDPQYYRVFCVRRLSRSLLDACKEAGIGIFDFDGNAYLKLPGLYVERIRPAPSSLPEPSSGTIFTAKATRIVRALLYGYPEKDWTRAKLTLATRLSAGFVSTRVRQLIAQGYVSDTLDLLYLDDPERLLDDWLAHYRFDRHQRAPYAMNARTYVEGIEKLRHALEAAGAEFAWTGWTGAHLRAAYAIPETFMAYVSQLPPACDALFPVEKNGNVVLFTAHDDGVFQFNTSSNQGNIVSDAQLYLDLCRMPGRAGEQADALRHMRLDFARMTRG